MLKDEAPIFEIPGPWGVPIQIAPSILLLPMIFISFSASADALFYDLIFVGLLVGSILLHELGHAWGCLVQGVPVRRVVLHGGGGFCEHMRSATPKEEELIVAMGPIVNLVIWAVASLVAPSIETPTVAWAIYWLAHLNLLLALFNLLPVMPLDGGKLFHLALMRVFPPLLATQIAGWIGTALTLIWVPVMVWVFFTFGFVLFFIPPLALHWQMARAAA